MALVRLPHPFWPWQFSQASSLFSTSSLNGATLRTAINMRAPKAGTIDSLEWKSGGSGSTCRVSMQTIDVTTGFPNNTVSFFRTAVAPTTGWQVWGKVTDDGTNTGVLKTVLKDEWFAIVWDFTSFVNSYSNIQHSLSVPSGGFWEKVSAFNGTVWGQGASALSVISIKYDDGTYACSPAMVGAYAASATGYVTVKSSDTPNEYALEFQSPYDTKVYGAAIHRDEGSLGACSVNLYDASSNLLSTVTAPLLNVGSSDGIQMVVFPSDIAIDKNTVYYLSVKPTTTTNIKFKYFDVNSTALLAACPGGSSWRIASRTGSGAWTPTTTRRPYITPCYSWLPDGAVA